MKLLGIDYGRRRIGLAVTDASGVIIRSLPPIDRIRTPAFIKAIAAIVTEEHAGLVIVGLPIDYNDRETEMSLEARKFASELRRHIAVDICLADEYSSSLRAAKILRGRKKKTRHNKSNTDTIAACLVIEAYQRGEILERIAASGSRQ